MFNILLQVLDDGRLTDNKGRVVNFKNTIIIMTSNLGSQYIQSQMEKGTSDEIIKETETHLLEMLKQTIRPEFLNRIDDIVMFQPLSQPQIEQIVRLQIRTIKRRLEEQNIVLDVADDAVALISREGFDPEFGARPVKRALQRLLLNDLSKALLGGNVDASKPINVTALGNELHFSNE